MSRFQSYRDKSLVRGTYAEENSAMLSSECSRTLAWQTESTEYKRSIVLQVGLALLLSAPLGAAALYAIASTVLE
jgi:hypothetical protein